MISQESRGRTNEEREYYSFSRRVYAIFAHVYDAVAFPIRKLRYEVASMVDLPPGGRLLDVATGTGQQAFAFAMKAREVVGIDLSEEMLLIVRRRNRFPNASFQQADAAELPFENNSFDASCVSFALHEMPSSVRERVVGEMARVTKPGGSIIIVDYGLPRSQMASVLTFHFVKVYERHYYADFVKSDWRTLLEDAGVEVVDDRPALRGMARIMMGRKAGSAARVFSGAAE
jgi:ubiquinone/menaquinone biosynthesis C-methylase UbiE